MDHALFIIRVALGFVVAGGCLQTPRPQVPCDNRKRDFCYSSRNARRKILPMLVFGKSSRNSMTLGTL